MKKIAFYDFDQTLSKKHTFNQYGLAKPAISAELEYEKGKNDATQNIKHHIQHNAEHISAIATYHNNPAFIAGFISKMLGEELKLKETIYSSTTPVTAINVYQVGKTKTPFLISYIPAYDNAFDATLNGLHGKNEQITHLRETLTQMGHLTDKDVIDFYDDTQLNVVEAKRLKNIRPHQVSRAETFTLLNEPKEQPPIKAPSIDLPQPVTPKVQNKPNYYFLLKCMAATGVVAGGLTLAAVFGGPVGIAVAAAAVGLTILIAAAIALVRHFAKESKPTPPKQGYGNPLGWTFFTPGATTSALSGNGITCESSHPIEEVPVITC